MIKPTIHEISAVVCSLNAEETIYKCLKSIQENGITEIILVDGNSIDRTKDIAKEFTNKIYNDPGKGLAIARNLGISKASREYILNFGCDNILHKDTLNLMLENLNEKTIGVSTMTKLLNPNKNFLSWSINQYKLSRYYPGYRKVIGTPNLFPRKILLDFKYDPNMRWSDDADLCDRLSLIGYKFKISNAFVYEIGSDNIKSLLNRWKEYGRGDSKIYKKYYKDWTFKRKIKSLLHPLYVDFILPISKIDFKYKAVILPFLLLIVFIRYYGWLIYSKEKN